MFSLRASQQRHHENIMASVETTDLDTRDWTLSGIFLLDTSLTTLHPTS